MGGECEAKVNKFPSHGWGRTLNCDQRWDLQSPFHLFLGQARSSLLFLQHIRIDIQQTVHADRP